MQAIEVRKELTDEWQDRGVTQGKEYAIEIIQNMLAETSTTDISKEEKPTTFDENQNVARRGGRVAGIARQALEAETGKPVITEKSASDFVRLISEVVKEVEYPNEDNENKNEET